MLDDLGTGVVTRVRAEPISFNQYLHSEHYRVPSECAKLMTVSVPFETRSVGHNKVKRIISECITIIETLCE